MPPSGKGRCDLIDMLTIKRRSFLTGSAGAVVAASSGVLAEAKETKVLPDYVAWKDANALIVHSDKTMETKRSEFGTSVITPEEKLYIRNNVNTPPESILADRDGWKVEISGVKEPRTLTVAELKSLGLVTAATVLQCSGNGRKYFKDQLTGNQKMSGTP